MEIWLAVIRSYGAGAEPQTGCHLQFVKRGGTRLVVSVKWAVDPWALEFAQKSCR